MEWKVKLNETWNEMKCGTSDSGVVIWQRRWTRSTCVLGVHFKNSSAVENYKVWNRSLSGHNCKLETTIHINTSLGIILIYTHWDPDRSYWICAPQLKSLPWCWNESCVLSTGKETEAFLSKLYHCNLCILLIMTLWNNSSSWDVAV